MDSVAETCTGFIEGRRLDDRNKTVDVEGEMDQ